MNKDRDSHTIIPKQKSMRNAIFYGVPLDSDIEIEGTRPPSFYLHMEAEAVNGFDLCNANEEALSNCLSEGAFLCKIKFTDGSVEDGICFSKWKQSMRHMEGLVCLLRDDEGIRHAVHNYLEWSYIPSMYSDERDYLISINKYNLLTIK